MSNVQTYYQFQLDFQKVDQHTVGVMLIWCRDLYLLIKVFAYPDMCFGDPDGSWWHGLPGDRYELTEKVTE